MAKYSHLSLYVKTYDFLKVVYRLVGQFRKEYKFSLGTELQSLIWQVMDEIINTNSLPDSQKKSGIEKISRTFERFKIRFRFAYEIGLITAEKFSTAQKIMAEIGKMINGWQKWADLK